MGRGLDSFSWLLITIVLVKCRSQTYPWNGTHGTCWDEIFNGMGGMGLFIFRDGRDGIKNLLSILWDGSSRDFYFSRRVGRDKNYSFDLIEQFSGRTFLLEIWVKIYELFKISSSQIFRKFKSKFPKEISFR